MPNFNFLRHPKGERQLLKVFSAIWKTMPWKPAAPGNAWVLCRGRGWDSNVYSLNLSSTIGVMSGWWLSTAFWWFFGGRPIVSISRCCIYSEHSHFNFCFFEWKSSPKISYRLRISQGQNIWSVNALRINVVNPHLYHLKHWKFLYPQIDVFLPIDIDL